MREYLRALRVMIATPFRAAPAMAAATTTLTAVSAMFTPVFGYGMKLITDGVVGRDMSMAVQGAVVLAGAEALSRVSGSLGIATLRMEMEERTRLHIERRIIDLVTGVPGLEHHERPDYLDELSLLRAERSQLAQPAGPVVFIFHLLVAGVGTLALLATIHPLLLLLPVFGVPAVLTGLRSERIRQDAFERTAEPTRLQHHLLQLLTHPRFAKEIRLFGLEREFINREARIGASTLRDRTRATARGTMISTAGSLVFAAGYVASVALVVYRAVHGAATIGDVMLTLTLAAQISALVAGSSSNMQWLRRVLRVVRRYLWLEDYARDAQRRVEDPAPVPDHISDAIEVDGVTFRYPGTETDVLLDVTLRLPAGSTVAIVGENGAGKTTLVKLLSRFYEPTSGRVTVDGIDIRRFDHEEWRARMSAAFQDFAKFELLAGENVGVGDVATMDTAGSVEGALERASATDVLTSLPDGLATQLGKSFDGGVDLSGGQWQKLALGRAMMREAPLLLVLDEPTASLDAETEHALFERYTDAARRVAITNGAITVLVSHRFSTVRMADVIVVLDGGRVVETGSHEELVSRGGLYAELFGIQARGYR